MFVDFPGPFNPDRICALLRRRFEVILEPRNPDFVIYSVFGHEHLKFPDAVRIFFTGENVHPDFNLCDYAFGYDWLEFGDRYTRCPNYVLYAEFRDLVARSRTRLSAADVAAKAGHFCNFIYSNRDAHPARDEFFHLLSRYRQVDSAGRHLNNIGNVLDAPYQGDWTAAKMRLQRQYRFSIAFENSSTPGYTTEKLVQALSADTIPIYWGNPEIGREFNAKRFINCHEFDTLEAVVERVRELDRDPAQYNAMLEEPFFPAIAPDSRTVEDSILDQFECIFSAGREGARRRNRHFWGAKYDLRRRREIAALAALERSGWRGKVLRTLAGLRRKQSPRSSRTAAGATSQ